MNADTRFSGRTLGLIAIGSMAFTLYGSLVPFDFQSRSADDAASAFRWAMTTRWWYESRSDAIANVMLGVPLGFGLLGFLRVGRTGAFGDLAVGVALLPFCLLFAAFVEYAQLFVPERTTSGSDVLCQGLGSAIGMAVWVVLGRTAMANLVEIWSGAPAAGRLLCLYLVLLAFVQLLPMDLSASPRDIYHKLRDAAYVPFSEVNVGNARERSARLMQVFGLFVPVGLLACRTRLLRDRTSWALPFSVGLAVAMEGIQVLVKSRVASASDVVLGSLGILAGWFVCGWRIPFVFFAVWLSAMAFISWSPFVLMENGPRSFEWIPGLHLELGHPLFTLEDMLTKVILFGLGGWFLTTRTVSQCAVVGLIAAGLFEAGQTVFASHTPSISDAILGSLGMSLGRRFRGLVEAGSSAGI